VLIHGAAAHSQWWDHVAPLIDPGRRVVALDLSGHGASDRRPAYSMNLWAREVLAVAEAACSGRPVLVGHSMGGSIAVAAAAIGLSATGPEAVIMLDTAIARVPTGAHIEIARLSRASRPQRVYATKEEAIRRFRTVPAQPESLPYVLRHIAQASVARAGGGWTWQADPLIFGHDRFSPDGLAAAGCPMTLIRAEHGIVSPGLLDGMSRASRSRLRVVPLPGAYHHMMIDKPLETIAAIKAELASAVHATVSDQSHNVQ
jgi:pimeloyl-ACP methyl ester carboxylesterase